jgi:hypothetical protein
MLSVEAWERNSRKGYGVSPSPVADSTTDTTR